MKKTAIACSLLAAALALTACDPTPPTQTPADDRGYVPDVDDDRESDPYTTEMLNTYKRALPDEGALRAPAPTSEAQAQLGDPALYPGLAAPQIMGVNALVHSLVETIGFITSLPPTFYNSETREFVWGPFDDENSALAGDKALFYIKDQGEDAELRYHYAFVRGMGNDLATYAPVIWGGGQPGETEDHGHGVVLYDFEANRAFEDAHNPDPGPQPAGRFAVAFGRSELEENPNSSATLVVSTFRGFVTAEEPDAAPVDLEQLYGAVDDIDGQGNRVDYVSILSSGNVHPEDEDDSLLEDIDLRLAFVNGGLGRAEGFVSGGDLVSDQGESTVHVIECWDSLIARTHLELWAEGEIAAGEPDGELTLHQEGDLSMCGPIFSQTLDELNVPSLADVDPDLMAALDEVASNGIGD